MKIKILSLIHRMLCGSLRSHRWSVAVFEEIEGEKIKPKRIKFCALCGQTYRNYRKFYGLKNED